MSLFFVFVANIYNSSFIFRNPYIQYRLNNGIHPNINIIARVGDSTGAITEAVALFEEALTLDPEGLFLEPEVLAQQVWENQQLAEALAARQGEETDTIEYAPAYR